jgi:hypothetical protein
MQSRYTLGSYMLLRNEGYSTGAKATGAPWRALSVFDFQDEYGARQHQGQRVRQDDGARLQKDPVYQPAQYAGAKEEPHREAHVFRAPGPEGFNGLWKKSKGREDCGDVSE